MILNSESDFGYPFPSPPLSTADNGSYRVRIQSSGGVTLSDPVQVTVVAANPPRNSASSPKSVSVHAGNPSRSPDRHGQWPGHLCLVQDSQPLGITTSDLSVLSASPPTREVTRFPRQALVERPRRNPPSSRSLPHWLSASRRRLVDGIHLPFNGIEGRTYGLETRRNC